MALKKIEFLIKREEERNLLFDTLQAEVKLVSELDHPNILKMYGTYSEYKYYFVVMEYSDGGNLFQKMAQSENSILSEPVASRYLKKILQTVSYMHSKGIMHRDI